MSPETPTPLTEAEIGDAISRLEHMRYAYGHRFSHEMVRALDVGIQSLKQAHPDRQWQDIATAPKDGRAIVGWCPVTACGDQSRVIAWRGIGRDRFAWRSQPGDWVVPVTHWIPLPDPPALAVGPSRTE